MAETIWKISYDIRKVNRDPHPMPDRQYRGWAEQMPKMLKQEAEQLVDRFDFAYVRVDARDLNSNETFHYIHQTDEGYRQDWTVGRP